MATFIKGDAVANATSYELLEKTAEGVYNTLATDDEINFEVSAIVTAAGDHTLVVKAKADGYEDSDPSNEVVYSVADDWVDITDQFNFVVGGCMSAVDGKYTTYNGWVATEEYVDISAYSEIEIKMSKTSSTGTGSGNAFYDENKTFVSGVKHTDGVATFGVMVKNIVLEPNVKYIRAMYWDKSSPNYKTEYGDFYCKAKLKS